jgi:multidrug resistance efflux pump
MSDRVDLKHSPTDNGSATLRDRVRSLRLADRPQAGAQRSSVIPWAACAILLAVTAAFGYRAYRVNPAAAPAAGAPAGERPLTASTVASSGDVALQAKGYVIPIHQIQVSPKVGGQLVWLADNFEEGQIFQKGQELARIEDVDYKAERDQALHTFKAAEQRWKELEAGNRPEEIEQAKSELEEYKRTLRQLKLDMDRSKRLTVSSALAARDYEQAKYSHDAMENRVNRLDFAYRLMVLGARDERKLAARAEMEQARAALAKAQWRLDNCVIRAPVTGTVLTKKAELGNVVNPSAFSSGISASLCDMADLRDLEIDLSIQERDIATVRQGQRCLVMPEAYQGDKAFLASRPKGYEGFVSRLMPTADRAKGAIPVRVRIPREAIPPSEAGKYLRPDMAALVSFQKTEAQGKK